MRVGDGGDRIYGFQFNEVNNEVTLRKSSKESEGGGGGDHPGPQGSRCVMAHEGGKMYSNLLDIGKRAETYTIINAKGGGGGGGGVNTAEHKHVHPLCHVERGTHGPVCCGCDWVVSELEGWK